MDGSANFTSGGFGMNEEALFETTDAQTVARWFDQLWDQCSPKLLVLFLRRRAGT